MNTSDSSPNTKNKDKSMDAQGFAKRIGEAVAKFGRAPEEMIQALLSDSSNHFMANENHANILADFLMDHEDPREHLVRRDLGYRDKSSDDYFRNSGLHLDAILGTNGRQVKNLILSPDLQ